MNGHKSKIGFVIDFRYVPEEFRDALQRGLKNNSANFLKLTAKEEQHSLNN